ncbi:unnamed protein product, partial [Phaeothamnion confervicola]
NKALREEYLALLQRRDGDAAAPAGERVKALRRMVLLQGLPTETEPAGGDDSCSLRGLIWKLLLGAMHIDAMLYIRLVEQGASWSDWKIRDDTFRTLRGDEEFQRRVPEDKLSRLNNAFVRLNFPDVDGLPATPGLPVRMAAAEALVGLGSYGGYVQGMTILCAPLLFVMPEVDAFFCFHALLTRHIP